MVLYAEFKKKTIDVEFFEIGPLLFEIFSFLWAKKWFFSDFYPFFKMYLLLQFLSYKKNYGLILFRYSLCNFVRRFFLNFDLVWKLQSFLWKLFRRGKNSLKMLFFPHIFHDCEQTRSKIKKSDVWSCAYIRGTKWYQIFLCSSKIVGGDTKMVRQNATFQERQKT